MRTREWWLVAGWAVVSSMALGACGPVDDGALPVLPRGGVAGSGERAASRLPASTDELATPVPTVEYRLDGTLPDLDGTASAYRLGVDVRRQRVEKLARALGLAATVEIKGEGGGWTASDGNRRLVVEPVAGLPWHFGEEAVDAVGEPECLAPDPEPTVRHSAAVTCERADSPVSSRPPPSRPPDLPSRLDAERRAADFFRDAGFHGSGVRIDDEFAAGWRAVLPTEVEGVDVVGLEQSVTIGSKGAIRWGSGFLAAPEKLGDYPLAGTRAGLSRLRDGSGTGPRPLPAVGAEPASSPPLVQTPPPPLVQTIVGAELVLMMVHGPCPGLPAHLVPAYRFRLADGAETVVVPAVEDRHLESPPAGEETAAWGCPGGDGGAEPAVRPEETPPVKPEEAPAVKREEAPAVEAEDAPAVRPEETPRPGAP